MLANKVSPASLCGNTRSSHSDTMLSAGGSSGEESQHSQNSLFNCDTANSMELFSQPPSSSSSSSGSQHSQSHSLQLSAAGPPNSQDEGRGGQCGQPNCLSASQQPQTLRGHNKYYLRYLSTASLSARMFSKQEVHVHSSTPPCAKGRHGDTAHSMAAFETWKAKQQDKLESKQLREDIITSTQGITKELGQTLENLRLEVKDALTSFTSSSQDKSHTEGLTRDILNQLLQGQAEVRQQLTELKALCSQQQNEIVTLQKQMSALERMSTAAAQSTIRDEMGRLERNVIKPSFDELGSKVTQLSEQLTNHTHCPSRLLSEVKEEDSGLGDTLLLPASHSSAAHLTCPAQSTSEPHTQHSASSSQTKRSQIMRKRKKSTARELSLSTDRESNEATEHTVPSQCSTGDRPSVPREVDLTQPSPSSSTHLLSQTLKRHHDQQQSDEHQKRARGSTRARQPAAYSPPQGPRAKKKRPTGKLRPATKASPSQRRGLSSLRGKRRSQRLSKLPPQGIICRDSSEDDAVAVVPSSGPGLADDAQDSVGGDVLSDWLDCSITQGCAETDKAVLPPPTRATHPATVPSAAGRFQRSSEAARRRMVVTEQMSSTLAGSDSVLKELFHSLPSP